MNMEPRLRDQENSISWYQSTNILSLNSSSLGPASAQSKESTISIYGSLYESIFKQLFCVGGEGVHHRICGELEDNPPADRFQGSNTGHWA